MMFPRAMNNKEKAMLKDVQSFGFAYELKFLKCYPNGGYAVNIPIMKETWFLDSVLTDKDRLRIKDHLSQ